MIRAQALSTNPRFRACSSVVATRLLWYKQSEMVRRLIVGLILAGFLALIYVGYRDWRFKRAMLSGEVSRGPDDTAVPEGLASLPETDKAANQPGLTASEPVTADATKQRASVQTGDTLNPEPPNGAVFAGTGHFQIYRQGNLTWRIDTDSGHSCILFATKEEWRKPLVYKNGCGDSAKR